MTTIEIVLLIISVASVILSTINFVLHLTLSRVVSELRLNTPVTKPSPEDHFAQLEKRLYDLTNQRFGGTIK